MHKEENKADSITIDVNKVIYNKNKKLHKYLPKFIVNYLRRIIHEDELNQNLLNRPDIKGVDFANRAISYFNITYTAFNAENIPKDGKYIIVGNHPLGGFDGLIMMSLINKTREDLLVTSNDILMNIPNLRELFIPINTTGTNTTELARNLEVAFQQENIILFFPAGLCSRRIKGEIVDLPWKKTFVSKAKAFQRDIIPFYFEGENSNFFYNLSNFRKKIGLKSNVEMIYLVDELFKHRNKHFKIAIGKPISHKTLTKDKSDYEHTNEIKKIVYNLKHKLH